MQQGWRGCVPIAAIAEECGACQTLLDSLCYFVRLVDSRVCAQRARCVRRWRRGHGPTGPVRVRAGWEPSRHLGLIRQA